MLIHQLRHVFIAGGDNDILLVLQRLRGQRTDDIVGLNALNDEQRQTHGADDVVDRLYLFAQLFRHGRTVGFVLGINVVAEGFSLGIKHRHQL